MLLGGHLREKILLSPNRIILSYSQTSPGRPRTWDKLKNIYSFRDDPKGNLIRAMPDIAAAEAARESNEDDAQGWLYLRDMFKKWLSGPANADAAANPDPFWVDWDWIMRFWRAERSYDKFVSPIHSKGAQNIYNKPARNQLAVYLQEDGKFTAKREEFDYTTLPWQRWLSRSFNYRVVRAGLAADGLQAAMGAFTLRALAKGYVEPNTDGTHTIHVTGCSVFVYDTFNFEGDESYGYWNYKDLEFSSYSWKSDAHPLGNIDFQKFSDKYGRGNDFCAFSRLHAVDNFIKMEYKYP